VLVEKLAQFILFTWIYLF